MINNIKQFESIISALEDDGFTISSVLYDENNISYGYRMYCRHWWRDHQNGDILESHCVIIEILEHPYGVIIRFSPDSIRRVQHMSSSTEIDMIQDHSYVTLKDYIRTIIQDILHKSGIDVNFWKDGYEVIKSSPK